LTGETSSIDAIVTLMRDNWDLPPDCNDGELYTYAEHLRDRIIDGDDAAGLEGYLQAIQRDKFDMPESDAYRVIVKGAVATSVAERAPKAAGVASTNESEASTEKAAAITDEDALPERLKNEAEPYDGSPV
jgi:hypothetical protein